MSCNTLESQQILVHLKFQILLRGIEVGFKIKLPFYKIAGTARHDEIKTRKCDKRTELFGTPEHDKIKKQKFVKRAELFGTPEHDQTKKNKQQNYSNIIGTDKHEKILAKKRERYAENNQEKEFLAMIQEGPYYDEILAGI